MMGVLSLIEVQEGPKAQKHIDRLYYLQTLLTFLIYGWML
jgi:hypothetical protein